MQKKIVLPPGIIKIKKGFNPNSSSIGTVIYSFPLVFVHISAIVTILASLPIKKRKSNGKK